MGPMEQLLRLMADKKASDIYLSASAPALIKINGVTMPVNAQPLPADGPDFTPGPTVCSYLEAYSDRFGVTPLASITSLSASTVTGEGLKLPQR